VDDVGSGGHFGFVQMVCECTESAWERVGECTGLSVPVTHLSYTPTKKRVRGECVLRFVLISARMTTCPSLRLFSHGVTAGQYKSACRDFFSSSNLHPDSCVLQSNSSSPQTRKGSAVRKDHREVN
jgi:hypothetical protein